MKKIAFVFAFCLSLFGTDLATVVKIKGSASVDGKELKVGDKLGVGARLVTSAKSLVVIKLNKSTIVVNAKSALKLRSKDFVEQEKGEAYYNILGIKSLSKKMNEKKSRKFKVGLKTATMGIRGTNFIVDVDNTRSIFLREGSVEIESVKNEFKIYAKKEQDAFEAFKKKQEKEFKSFIDKDRFAFEEEKKSFLMNKGQSIVIDGDKVYKFKKIKKSFKQYDDFVKGL